MEEVLQFPMGIPDNCEENSQMPLERPRRRRRRRNGPRLASASTTIWLFAILPLAKGQFYDISQLFGAPQPGAIPQQQQAIQRQGPNGAASSEPVSIRLIDEILEIFVPADKFGSQRNSAQNGEEGALPYGLNRLMPRTARSRDWKPERMEDTQVVPPTERRFSPVRNNFGGASSDSDQAPWASLARGVLNMFRGIELETTTPTTTTTTSEMSLLEKIMPKLLSPFGLGSTAPPPTGPPLFPFFAKATTTAPAPSLFSFFRQEQPKKEAAPTNPLVEPVARLFGVEKKAVEEGRAQIDTGGNSFDRFVVREKVDPDNPLTAIIGGAKWNERGIKWEDGNIRLVNKNGNSFLGSELGVNDRSVDIPLRRWLDIANGLVNYNQAQQERVARW